MKPKYLKEEAEEYKVLFELNVHRFLEENNEETDANVESALDWVLLFYLQNPTAPLPREGKIIKLQTWDEISMELFGKVV